MADKKSAEPAADVGSTSPAKRLRTAHYGGEPPALQHEMKATLANETKCRYVGPVDPLQFLEDYLPRSNSIPPAPRLSEKEYETLCKGVSGAKSEAAIYKPFKTAFQIFAPGMKFEDTSSSPSTGTRSLKPDFCLYEEATAASQTTDFSTVEMCIEAKYSLSYDPFEDPDGKPNSSFEKDTVQANDTRGQITTYAVTQFSCQFRTFAFSVVIVKDHARFVRWDRAGAIISARFNYLEELDLLTDFFWRFSHLSREQRGHDASVSPASLSEEDAQNVRGALKLEADTPLFAFTIPQEGGDKLFYGPRFPFNVLSLIGRASRTVPVCDFVNGEPRKGLLKEYWRADEVPAEIEVYKRLMTYDIKHIAPLIGGGDVPLGETRTDKCSNMALFPISHRRLHRLVLGFVGRRLTEFKSTKELTQAVLHAMTAHWQAYTKANVLHCDITADNILMKDNGEGILVDWETARFLDNVDGSETRQSHDYSVTWQFVSAALLKNPGRPHELSDDLESFVHVLGWTVLTYLASEMDGAVRKELVSLLYDRSTKTETGQEQGGHIKANYLLSGDYPPQAFKPAVHSPIFTLIRTLASPFQALYRQPSTEEEEKTSERTNVQKGRVEENAVNLQHADQYNLGMERLQSSDWFLKTIEDALGYPDWPHEDKAAGVKLLTDTEGTPQQRQLAKKRLEDQARQVAASKHPLKRGTTPPLKDQPDKHARLC